MIQQSFWKDKHVFVTGHTGFKGAWLCLLLDYLGAKVTGYGLEPPTNPSLFEITNINNRIVSIIADIRDREEFKSALRFSKAEILIHMAAQPLVRESYKNPVETFETNIMGTVNLFEAVRNTSTVKAVVNVTTDKCYENKGGLWGYRENEPLGGYDPYSSSKACSELVTSAYRNSFFHPSLYYQHGVAIASARAGNVIGGGDWATDRLIPDCIRSLISNDFICVRNPQAIRPWQHVLEPLSGYLLLAQKLYENGSEYAEGWNFGPDDCNSKPVEWIVNKMCEKWGTEKSYIIDENNNPYEAHYLKLDCTKAKVKLGWEPKWDLDISLNKIIDWTKANLQGSDMTKFSLRQIEEYLKS